MNLRPTIHRVQTCTSTNTIALDLAKNGAVHGTMVVTEKQTEGRGRQGRAWITANENLTFSIILRPRIPTKNGPRLTFVAAIALLETLHQFEIEAYVKWPNDIVILAADQKEIPILGPFRKVAGILTEICSTGSQIETAVVGMGINIRHKTKTVDFKSLPQAGFLADSGFTKDKEELLNALVKALQKHFDQIHSPEHWLQCLEKMRHFSATLNRNVNIDENPSVVGKAIAIGHDGSLQIQLPDGSMKAIYAGDIWISQTHA